VSMSRKAFAQHKHVQMRTAILKNYIAAGTHAPQLAHGGVWVCQRIRRALHKAEGLAQNSARMDGKAGSHLLITVPILEA
jgi:hypothetical protein